MFVPRVKYEVPRVMSTSDQRSPCATRTPATAASASRRAAMTSGRNATADRVRLSRSSGPRNATGPAHALGAAAGGGANRSGEIGASAAVAGSVTSSPGASGATRVSRCCGVSNPIIAMRHMHIIRRAEQVPMRLRGIHTRLGEVDLAEVTRLHPPLVERHQPVQLIGRLPFAREHLLRVHGISVRRRGSPAEGAQEILGLRLGRRQLPARDVRPRPPLSAEEDSLRERDIDEVA